MDENRVWTVVELKKRKVRDPPPAGSPLQMQEPCWFYNNGGCHHKDGTEKKDNECKYSHVKSENAKRPLHLSNRKPCDKFNLEGECRWYDKCKYSHRDLTPEEWGKYYPMIPYNLKTNVKKRLEIESRLQEMEYRLKVLEYKQSGMQKDLSVLNSNTNN